MITKVNLTSHDLEEVQNVKIDGSLLIDDFFDYSKVIVRKPWGYEYLMYQNEHVAVWILYIKSGFQTSMHCHPSKKTSLVILSGTAVCSTLQSEHVCSAGDGLLIVKGVFHSTRSVSEEGIVLMEIETPVNKRDLIRLEDKYGRVGKGYESVNEMSFNIQNYNYISFIDSKIYYNVKKKFGMCSLFFAQFDNYGDLKRMFERESWGAISILKGKIVDDKGLIVLDVGDTIDIEQLHTSPNLSISDTVEVIITKKRDQMIKLSDFVITFLEKEMIRDFFVVPGSSNVHLLDSVGRNTNIRYVCTQTEQAAVMAAEAYAKSKCDVAVAIIPSGCSQTSALVGVADAWVDSTPLLIISGQTRSDQIASSGLRQLGIQELDVISIVKPITKYAVRVDEPNSIQYHLQKALHIAKSGRPGPVWIDLPIDIQGTIIDEEELYSFDRSQYQDNNVDGGSVLSQKIRDTFQLLQKASRPVILAGRGIRLGKAEKDFLKLIELLGIPVLTSRGGADLLAEDHPLFFGRPGAYGQRNANFVIQNADVLLCIGARLSLPQIGRNYKAFAREAKIVMVDIDKEELRKKTIQPYISIHCSSNNFISELFSSLKLNPVVVTSEKNNWVKQCGEWKKKYSDWKKETILVNKNKIENKQGINAYFLMDVLSQLAHSEHTITADGVSPIVFVMQEFKFKSNQRLILASGLENTNFALSASIGCSVASGKEVICICEEGGFLRTISEIETILKYKLPIKIFVLNNTGNSYVRETQRDYFGGRYVATSERVQSRVLNVGSVASAYGIPFFSFESEEKLYSSLEKEFKHSGPALYEIKISPQQKISPKITFTVKPDGKWVSKPLEDMYPFLERKEFKENMYITPLEEAMIDENNHTNNDNTL